MLGQTWQPGAQVTPSIRLVRLLGRGGMGSVWIADHLGLRTQVVVKFVALELATMQEARERFEREAALAAQARSPHVVQVFDHGVTASGVPYIAMELLEGEDLGARIAREGVIDPVLFSGWLTQACKGLGRAHGKGIVHRDIKPDNIFLSDLDGEIVVKVLDFGIAKADGLGDLLGTKSGALMGTAPFMSPEQTIGARSIDLRTDLWSMAVTTYLALTGHRPFPQDSIGAVILAITGGAITAPSIHNPRLGAAIDAWMTKALARPVEERFASAKEMAESFAAAVAQPVTGPFGTAIVPSRPPAGTAVVFTPPSLGPSPPAPPLPRPMTTSVGVVSENFGDVRGTPSVEPPVPRAPKSDRRVLALGALATLGFLVALGVGARSLIADSVKPPATASARGIPSTTTETTNLTSAPAVSAAKPTELVDASVSAESVAAAPAIAVSAIAPAKPAPPKALAPSPPRLGAPREAPKPEAKPNATASNNPLHMGLE